MVELTAVPNIPLKAVFAVHFILISWGIQGFWSPDSYLFYNLFFLLTVIWGIYEKEREEPLQIAILINIVAVVMDIFVLSLFFPYHSGGGNTFSVAMAILNLVFRPISVIIMGKNCANRMGLTGGFYPSTFASIFDFDIPQQQRSSYEDIDGTASRNSGPVFT